MCDEIRFADPTEYDILAAAEYGLNRLIETAIEVFGDLVQGLDLGV